MGWMAGSAFALLISLALAVVFIHYRHVLPTLRSHGVPPSWPTLTGLLVRQIEQYRLLCREHGLSLRYYHLLLGLCVAIAGCAWLFAWFLYRFTERI